MNSLIDSVRYVGGSRSSLVLARYPEWLLDAVVGAMISPSDATIISGFWRSGTTWLLQSVANSLDAKSLFEPLLPHIGPYEKAFSARYPSSLFSKRVKSGGIMPYCSHDLDDFPGLKRHLRHMLVGALPGHFVRTVRESKKKGEKTTSRITRFRYRIQEAFRRHIVVKLVRGALILPLIAEEFHPNILHVRRDPRAVVASYKRQDWTDWMKESSLQDLLLSPPDGRSDVFRRWEQEIQNIDEMGYAARIAGYWALTEWYVDRHGNESNIASVRYERLCTEGAGHLNDALSAMRSDIHVEENFLRRESHTSNRSPGENARSRIWGWKKEMPLDDIRKVETAVDMVGMTDSLVEES